VIPEALLLRGILRTCLSLLTVLPLVPGGIGESTAHELRPAYLAIRETQPNRYEILWKVPARGSNERPALSVVWPEALTIEAEPQREFINNAHVERSCATTPTGLSGEHIRIAGLEAMLTDVLVRVEPLNGTPQVLRLTPNQPAFVVQAVRTRWQAVHTYLALGVEHILLGVDHLLFVLGLLLIVPGRWTLLKTITAFTIAHSITLAIATLGYASAPAEPLNAAIALSILFLGPEIVRYRRGETSFALRHPWVVAFAFGLLHGFGFASGLNTLGMPQGEIPLALLFFNVGVELGQLAFVLLITALAWSFRLLEIRWTRPGWVMPAYAVGGLGAYWFIQRLVMMMGGWRG
jgi:hypothetical protein